MHRNNQIRLKKTNPIQQGLRMKKKMRYLILKLLVIVRYSNAVLERISLKNKNPFQSAVNTKMKLWNLKHIRISHNRRKFSYLQNKVEEKLRK